jgi:dihydroorotate dehydrogenase electron transfer subunit
MTTIEIGTVRRSAIVAPGVAILDVEAPDIAAAWRPGTFVHLQTGGADTVLRRPFSVARVRGREIVLLYRVVGSGTEWMTQRRFGDPVDLMGPLGRGFDLRLGAERVLLVGGGLGIAPLLGLAESLTAAGAGAPMEALLGVRSAGDLFGPALTEGLTAPVEWKLATDDGSDGFHGNASQLLAARLGELRTEGTDAGRIAVYAAGPEPMLAAVAAVCEPHGLDLQISMEAHMGCGVGACRACGIVTWKDRTRINGRVCCEGPVFDAREILWEEVGA